MISGAASISHVPRHPVVDCGEGVARVGVDFDQAPWPEQRGVLSLERAFQNYVREHVIPNGGDVKRTAIALGSWLRAINPQMDVKDVTRADGRAVVNYDIARGRLPATARRNMAMGVAALNHASKEGLLKEGNIKTYDGGGMPRDDGYGVFVRTVDYVELERRLSDSTTFQLAARTAETLDAERYRYLRIAAAMDEGGPAVWDGPGELFDVCWGAEVDEAVDESMARWKAAGCPLPKEPK